VSTKQHRRILFFIPAFIAFYSEEIVLKQASYKYAQEPKDNGTFTEKFDRFYTRFARTYDLLVKYTPVWRNWITQALPYIQGKRVLEISFGTGYLLTQYADRFQCFGIDYNVSMTRTAGKNLWQRGLKAELQRADVNFLPYKSGTFDTIVNTMAFSGYANGRQALAEMDRVLKPGGRLVMIDINHPKDQNWLGTKLTEFWMAGGDIIRDMDALFKSSGWEYSDKEIGAFGSVHLYIASNFHHGP